jgi:hypothetical protein
MLLWTFGAVESYFHFSFFVCILLMKKWINLQMLLKKKMAIF